LTTSFKARGYGRSRSNRSAFGRWARRASFFWVAAITAAGATRITPAQPESLQQGIIEAYRAHEQRVVIPPGTYRIAPRGGGSHLEFRDMSDFEIDATGVQLVFTDQTRGGIEFRNCRNVRFHGASIRYQVPPFTQGVVAAIAPDGTWYDVRLDPGYPANFDDPRYFPAHAIGYLFDRRTRLWKTGTYDLYGERLERLARGRFRVYWNRPAGPALHPVAIGDLMAFRGAGQHNIAIANCARMALTGITIYNAGVFAVWEVEGDGDSRYNIAVKRGPRPAGARTDPLLSSTADAFHSVNVRKGPTLENCDFESMGDDGIAIHGTFSLVFAVRGNALVINRSTFRPGDPLRLFDPDGRPAGEAVVRSIRALADFQNTKKSRRVTLSDPTSGPYFEVTLDRPLQADFDYLASNPAAMGSGYVLRNNTIRNHRARGMLLKAENGLVEGNTVEGSTMGGIVLTPEFWWNEAGYSRNVTVRNNTIRHVAYAPEQVGAVELAAIVDKPVPGCGHQRILIEGNRFENLDGVNLFVSSACDVIVRRNSFIHPQHAAVKGERAGSLVFVTEAQGVRFEGNTVSALGAFNKILIQTTDTARVEGSGRIAVQ
jgi:Right handed beta helix region